MVAFFDELTNDIMVNIIGGSAAQAVTMGSLFIMTILVVMLLASRVDLSVAFVIISPAIIVASFSGLLPPLSFGIVVLVLAFFFSGIILAITSR